MKHSPGPFEIARSCSVSAQDKEGSVITAIVRFKLPSTVKRDEATALYKSSMPKYQGLPGLVRKYYLFDEQGVGGGYLWESRAAAERVIQRNGAV
jgi:hypothetical protein